MNRGAIITLLSVPCLLLVSLLDAGADELPPPDGKPLSTILKSVEDKQLGSIVEAEFDDGLWEVKVCNSGTCQKLYIAPRTGEEVRRRRAESEEVPPAGSKPVSTIVQSVEAQGLGTITEVEFEHGRWEVKLRKDGQTTRTDIDPMTGVSKH